MSKHPVLVGVAWPYANGRLHLGHVAGNLLPPDIFRRFCRMRGHPTLMISGSDCHGTPIMLQAEKEGISPPQLVERVHADHVEALRRLELGFDLYTTTHTPNHIEWVQRIFEMARGEGLIEFRTMPAAFDPAAGRFLPDRYVEGTCPHCGFDGARGDQCDDCGKTLDAAELIEPRSKLNPETAIEFRDTEHAFFLLSKLQPDLERHAAQNADHWRPSVRNFTQNWLREGLQDRAITRDLSWGIPLPEDLGSSWDDKRIYVWFEAVCGYLTAAIEWAARSSGGTATVPAGFDDLPEGSHTEQGAPLAADHDGWQRWWSDPECKVYNFLGKDNIPFHTIIWPGILTAYNRAAEKQGSPTLNLPHDVPANEFLNLSGQQFSKSRGISISVHDVLDRFDADAVRYYLSINMPEQRDSDWVWDDFLSKVNDELVGTYGNLVHRVLSFTHKNLGTVPAAPSDSDLERDVLAEIESCGRDMAAHLDRVELKKALRRFMEFAAWGNQTMQEVAPWKLLKADPAAGADALYALLRIVKALAVYSAPYVPGSAEKVWGMLAEEGSVHDAAWDDATAPLQEGADLPVPQALFRKLEPSDLPTAPQAGESSKPDDDQPEDVPQDADLVDFTEFQRLKLRLAKVTSVEDHPNADKLYVLRLDVGELGERQVVAGLKGYYAPDELVGQTVAFIANLKPAKLRGIESQGMILAADHDGTVAVLNPQRELPAGATIR